MIASNEKTQATSPTARVLMHLGTTVALMLVGVFLYYLGDLPWLQFYGVKGGFLGSGAFHEISLLVITASVVYAAVIFRLTGGIVVSLVSAALLAPHTLLFSPYQDSFFRAGTFAIIGLLLAAFIGTLLNSRDRIKAEHQRLEIFMAETLEKQELERQHLAHELHDETAQELVDISHKIDELLEDKSFNRPDVAGPLKQVRHDVDNVLEGTRRFIHDIRPPLLEELGLKPALIWLADQTMDESNIRVKLDIAEPLPRMARVVEMNLFRIAQEALSNIRRHSQASVVDLSIKVEANQVSMKIIDNGVGFVVPAPAALAKGDKFGIMGMIERARLVGGIAWVESAPGVGTTVTVRMPLGADNRQPIYGPSKASADA